jgi:hypothetical protein
MTLLKCSVTAFSNHQTTIDRTLVTRQYGMGHYSAVVNGSHPLCSPLPKIWGGVEVGLEIRIPKNHKYYLTQTVR